MTIITDLDVTSVLATFAVSLIIFLIYKKFRERNYPPGPIGLPVLGYAPFLKKDPHKVLKNLSKQYGDIFSFTIFSKLHICVTDYYMMKDLLTNPVMLSRPPNSFDFLRGKGGMGGVNGEEWREQRRFAFFAMRNLGLGKGLWEQMIQSACEEFVAELKDLKGKPKRIEDILSTSVANSSISLLVGRRFDPKKEADTLQLIQVCTRLLMEYMASTALTVSNPWITKFMVFFRLGGFHKFFPILRKFENIFSSELERRQKSPDSMEKEDFIGLYYKEMKKQEQEGKSHYFHLENLLGNLFILFIAGNDSSMASVSWLLLLMVEYPEIQKKIHDEIDSNIGKDGVVHYDFKTKLVYTMATICEMWRYVSIAAIFPPRYVPEDIQFAGYTLPKGSHVIANAWAIMHDPRYFKDPESFKPERFLTQDGKICKLDGWAPFSIGKRNCPGEGVAHMSVFLYFVHIMQKFKIALPPGKKANMKPVFGGALLTEPQELCFIER